MSNLKVMTAQLEQAKSVKEGLQLPFVQELFIKNYESITGRKDGENRFRSELFHYLEMVNDNEKLKAVDKFSHLACIVKAGTTGLSFAKEGQLYVIPYGNVAKVQIGAHGKRELMRRMPDVKFVGESQIVLKGDTFKHDKLNNRVIEHITSEKAPVVSLDNIVAVYVRIIFKDNNFVDVVVPHDDIVRAKAKSKNQREGNTWDQWPGEMSRKVAYNRAYKLYYRQPQVEVTDFKGFDAPEDDDAADDIDVTHQVVPQEQPQQPIQEAAVVQEPVAKKPTTDDDF